MHISSSRRAKTGVLLVAQTGSVQVRGPAAAPNSNAVRCQVASAAAITRPCRSGRAPVSPNTDMTGAGSRAVVYAAGPAHHRGVVASGTPEKGIPVRGTVRVVALRGHR